VTEEEPRWFDVPAVLCFLGVLLIIGLRIQATEWTNNLSLVQFGMLLAGMLGLALGMSRFNRKAVFWMTAAFSLTGLTWLTTLLLPGLDVWAEKLIYLYTQVTTAAGRFLRNESIRGPLLFMVTLIFAFWWLSFLAGYKLTRRGRPWLPLGILFITLIIVDYYPPAVSGRHWYTALVVLLLILLMGRLYYLESHQRWKAKRAMVDSGAGFDVGRGVLVSASLLIFTAWGLPAIPRLLRPGTVEQQKMVDFWQPLQERLANMVSDLRAPRTASVDFYSKNLWLGTEISGEETPIFSVTVSERRAGGYLFYWRGYSYDQYQGGRWSNTVEDYHAVNPADWPQELPEWRARQKIDLEYTWLYPRSRIVYLPGSPLEVSRQVNWIAEENADGLDGVSIIAETSIYQDEKLEAEALVSVPAKADLEAAGTEYPEWVVARYLQLPENLPQRIRDLAVEITDGIESPFEQAQAVTRYLRENMKYSQTVEPAPEGEDPIAWFLFESRQGFCNYYASAEVLMLRSLGIPARMTAGFAQGDVQDGPNTFVVQLKHAHAWPEVYFPGIGWVEFEPTVSRIPPEIYYEEIVDDVLDFYILDGLSESYRYMYGMERFGEYANESYSSGSFYLPRVYDPWREWAILGVVLVLIGAVFGMQRFGASKVYDRRLPVLIGNVFRRRGWEPPQWVEYLAQRAVMEPIGRYFTEIPWMLRLLRVDFPAGLTPAEQIGLLVEKTPQAAEPAHTLLREYETVTFSTGLANAGRARKARARLWGRVLWARLTKPAKR
jgi:transglutaminase-like putative cysteine protease